MSQEETFKCRVPLKAEGMTLVGYLSSRFTYYAESDWQRMVDAEKIALNGQRPVEGLSPIKAGDEIIYFADRKPEPKVPTRIPIVYEDEDLIVVNKPAHLPVHPSGKYSRNTLVNLLKKQKNNDRLILAHRLDRETSGLCVLTKSTLAKEKMYWAFYEGRVEKTYWALVWGKPQPGSGSVDAPMGPVPKGNTELSRIRIKQVVGASGSKRAQTKYRTLQTNWVHGLWMPPPWKGLEAQVAGNKQKSDTWPVSLVECRPMTGRTNQIRVHMAHIGCGLVGDKLYDPSEEIFIELTRGKPLLEDEAGLPGFRLPAHMRPRLVLDAHALHARALHFRHPRSGQSLHLEAPAPREWQGLYLSR
ncbi:MAG: RluA family pseudouridine synthase [Bdellovibrionota bacterium]